MRLRQNGRLFADNIFKCIYLNENFWILKRISLKHISYGLIDNMAALVQIIPLSNMAICTQNMQRTWGAIASATIVPRSYSSHHRFSMRGDLKHCWHTVCHISHNPLLRGILREGRKLTSISPVWGSLYINHIRTLFEVHHIRKSMSMEYDSTKHLVKKKLFQSKSYEVIGKTWAMYEDNDKSIDWWRLSQYKCAILSV